MNNRTNKDIYGYLAKRKPNESISELTSRDRGQVFHCAYDFSDSGNGTQTKIIATFATGLNMAINGL